MKDCGVLLLNLGGPDSLEAVEPFLYNLFSDKDIIRLPLQKYTAKIISTRRAGKAKKNYQKIGGKSPILEITRNQSRALEEKLKESIDCKCYIGMRYWHPTIEEGVWQAKSDGWDRLIVVPLYPHYSVATTGSCVNELERVMEKMGGGLKVDVIEPYYDHKGYLDALAEKVEEGLMRFPDRKTVHVIFSAHGLPQKFIDEGDPYIDHTKATINGIWERVGEVRWHLAYQSRSGPVKWIGPETGEVIDRLAGEGAEDILVVPVSFVSDHIETLYEIDMLFKDRALKAGIKRFERTGALDTAPKFIDALADIVLKKVR
jgi:ferrochelatase